MPDKITAAQLTRRASFLRAIEERDDDGMIVQGWQVQFTCAAHVHYLRGNEAVMQARLQSRSPAIVTVRDFPAARAITSEWRVKIDGRTFDCKEDPRPDQARRILEMLVEG